MRQHIFISYSRQDRDYAVHVRRQLEASGYKAWMDEVGLGGGEHWIKSIEQAIENCYVFVLIASPDSKSSEWVQRELLRAQELKKPIIPLLRAGEPWFVFLDIQYIDVRHSSRLPDLFFSTLERYEPQDQVGLARGLVEPRRQLQRARARKRRVSLLAIGMLAGIVLLALLLSRNDSRKEDETKADSPVATATTTIAVVELPSVTPETIASPTPTVTIDLNAPVTRNADWIPVIQDFGGVEMVLVPPGCFIMGNAAGSEDEQPVESQCVDKAFWLDRHEVSNAEFAALDGRAVRQSAVEDANHPREQITWLEAHQFCALRETRLPTEREWEYAARGPDNLTYPWGNVFIPNYLVFNTTRTAEVGTHGGGRSWVGAMDMSGNVWEWVSTLYRPYPYREDDGREDSQDRSNERVARGGFWGSPESEVYAANRYKGHPLELASSQIGFRCARDY